MLRRSRSPRPLLRRFRLGWMLVLLAAAFVWLVASVTEPAGPEAGTSVPPEAGSRMVGDGRALSPVASSPEAAARFFRKVATAVQAGIHTGRVDLTITEAEATSALDVAAQLAEIQQVLSTLSPEELEALDTPEKVRAALNARRATPPTGPLDRVRYALNPRLGFREAQVRFRPDGSVVVSGYAEAWSRRLSVHMNAVPALEDGRLRMEFRETRLGRLPVPAWVLGGPANLLGSVLGLGKDHAGLDALVVTEGRFRVAARLSLPATR